MYGGGDLCWNAAFHFKSGRERPACAVRAAGADPCVNKRSKEQGTRKQWAEVGHVNFPLGFDFVGRNETGNFNDIVGSAVFTLFRHDAKASKSIPRVTATLWAIERDVQCDLFVHAFRRERGRSVNFALVLVAREIEVCFIEGSDRCVRACCGRCACGTGGCCGG